MLSLHYKNWISESARDYVLINQIASVELHIVSILTDGFKYT